MRDELTAASIDYQLPLLIRIKKRSFSLVEVIISLIFVGVALSPLLHDQSIRLRKYIELIQKLHAEHVCEEIFARELTLLVLSNEYTFPNILNGYTKKESLEKGLKVTIDIFPIEVPQGVVSDSPQYCLSTLTVTVSPESMKNEIEPLSTRSVNLVLHERKGV